jgi:tetratricopeptide (TPR) repeat protein
MKRHLALAALASIAIACGGGNADKPPTTPATSDTSPKSASTGNAPASSGTAETPKGPMEGPTAKPSSDDVGKGIAAMKKGDWNGAKEAFEAAIKKNPKQADAHHYLGVVMEKTGDRAAAKKHYEDALAADPALEEAAVNLVAINIEDKKWDDAIKLAKSVLAKNAKNAPMHVNLAVALAGKDDKAGATKSFEDAIKLEPNKPDFYITYAQYQTQWGKRDEAIATLKKAQGTAGDDPATLAGIAIEFKNLKDYDSCIAAMDKAIAAKDAAELRVYRGHCKLGKKDLPAALADFQEAVKKEPNSAPPHYSLGNALADSGKFAEAITEWETYLKLAPTGPFAKNAEGKIKVAKTKMKK